MRPLNVAKALAVPGRGRVFGIRLVLCVFLFNAVAPAGLIGQGFGGTLPTGLATGPAGKSIVICMPNGVRVIRLDADGRPIPENDKGNAFCVFCLPFAEATTDGLDARETFPRPGRSNAAMPAPADGALLRPAVTSGRACPRAPPIIT